MTEKQLAAVVRGFAPVIKAYLVQAQHALAERDADLRLELTKENGVLRERVAVLETRPLLPGPAGDPGPPGKDGFDGKDGAPGLAFKGVYHDDQPYAPGEIVRWGGSTYHCVKATTGVKPDATPPYTTGPDGTKAFRGVSGTEFWELFVSKGDPGKAAK